MELKYMTTRLALYLFNFYLNTAVDIGNDKTEIEQDEYFIYNEGQEKHYNFLCDQLKIVDRDLEAIVNYLRSAQVSELLVTISVEGPEDREELAEHLRSYGINIVDHIEYKAV